MRRFCPLIALLLVGCADHCLEFADRLEQCPLTNDDLFTTETARTKVVESWRSGECTSESDDCAECYVDKLNDDCSNYPEVCTSECSAGQ